jgi:DeoR/GlpR family transcriptional regulator of sugar metabolism
LHRLAPVADFDLIIVDDRISPTDRADLEALGVTVEVASMDDPVVTQRTG